MTEASSLFFFLLIASLCGYASQAVLLAHYARKLDGLSTAVYRGLTLCITMSPLLLFGTWEEFLLLREYWHIFLISGICGALANALSLQTMRFLPLGIQNSFDTTFKSFFFLGFGFLFYGEILTSSQFFFGFLTILAALFLGLQKFDMHHIQVKNATGIALSFLASLCGSTSVFTMSFISRGTNPFLTGYMWEVIIALCSVCLGVFLHKAFSARIKPISLQEFSRLGIAATPTLVGTACLAYALQIGPISIAGAINTGGVFVSALLAFLIYREKLTLRQIALLFLSVIGIVGLKLVSS